MSESNPAPSPRHTKPSRGPKRSSPSTLSAESLEKLRGTVRRAANELRRLRSENVALHKRIRELETSAGVRPGKSFVKFDHDPAELRNTVEGFIQTIDNFLAEDPS